MLNRSVLDWVVMACGCIVLILGQRYPKSTGFALGLAAGAWGVNHSLPIASDVLRLVCAVVVGVVAGFAVLFVRKLLPMALGLVVGGYLFWLLPLSEWGMAIFGKQPDFVWVTVAGATLVFALFMASRLVSIVERIAISLSGALLICVGADVLHQPEWVLGLALAGLAIDGLRRH